MHQSGVAPEATRINPAQDGSEGTGQWIRLYNCFVRGLDFFRDYAHQSSFLELLSSPCLQVCPSLRSWTLHSILIGVLSVASP
jgi:hypothetical protein